MQARGTNLNIDEIVEWIYVLFYQTFDLMKERNI